MSPPPGKPRGVLRPSPAEGTFSHDRLPPPPDLAPFVEHLWSVSWEVPEPVVREVLPHPSVHVVLERGRSAVAGVPRGRFVRRLEGSGVVLGIKFRPGGFRPFVTYPVSRLTGRTVPIAEVLGGESAAFEEAFVLSRHGLPSMAEAAAELLRERLPPRDPLAEEAAALVARILEDREIRRVEDVARVSGKGPRALQRLFGEYVGVSPKWVIRRYRLHEALERVDAGDVVDWPGLALELGYFDQAHFIRDFRSLVGRTPAAYARR